MVDTFQILLAIVILTLTVILALVGIQIFLILREVQKGFQKVNTILDEIRKAANSASESLVGLSGFLGSIKAISSIFSLFKKKKEGEKEK